MQFLPDNIAVNVIVLLISFYILAKSADFLVDGAVGIAYTLKIPKVIIGIVLVSFATTSPEFTVSLLSAIQGHPEIALGNAVGSVIVNTGLAIALAAFIAGMSGATIHLEKSTFITTGLFLVMVMLLSFVFGMNGTISRVEGIVLLGCLAGYLIFLFIHERRKSIKHKKVARSAAAGEPSSDPGLDEEISTHIRPGSLLLQCVRFAGGVLGVVIASELLVESAVHIAHFLSVPEVVIGLTIIAIGTSLPEIATCVVASRKGHGDLAFGDILGANILNIVWIIGAAATANPIMVATNVILFAFPAMIVMVSTMLLMARVGYQLNRSNGIVLIVLYIVYLVITIAIFYVG